MVVINIGIGFFEGCILKCNLRRVLIFFVDIWLCNCDILLLFFIWMFGVFLYFFMYLYDVVERLEDLGIFF